MNAHFRGVGSKYIVELLDEGMRSVLRNYIIEQDCILSFPYLKEGRYCMRITSDANRNSIVDTGNLLEHRQPEMVKFADFAGDKFLMVPPSAELDQTIDLKILFGNE